jgi:protocatechuate 3,4-dioxygenase beta subunit
VAVVPFETAIDIAHREARDLPSPPSLLATQTGADGTFVVGLPPGGPTVQLRIEAPGFVSAREGDAYDGTETVDVGDVTLSRAAALTGRVVDGRGTPLADATVGLEPGVVPRGENEGLPETCLARTGPDGSFRFDGASRSGNRLRVGKGAFASAALDGLRAGALASPIVLGPAAVRTGAVRRVDGRTPATGVLVRFEGKAVTRWFETGADGGFTISDAPAAPGRVVAEGAALGRGEARVAASSPAPLVIVLDPPTRIAGRVVNAKTLQPVPRVRIEARAQGRAAVARSGPDGRYVLEALAPGTYRVSADEPRFARYVRQDVRVRLGQTRAVDLPLTLAATLVGRVVDEEGRPVAGAVGRLSRPQRGGGGFGGRFRGPRNGDAIAFRTGADGSFRAERLSPGAGQRLTVAHPQFEPRIVGGLSLSPGGVRSGLTVVLRHGLEITGFVRDSEGRPVEGAEVALVPSASERSGGGRFAMGRAAFDPERTRAASGPDGRYHLAGLEPGAYSLRARKDGYAEGRVELLRLDSGQTPAVDVWLLPGATISGFVRRPDGSGARGFVVRALGGGDEPRSPAPGPPEATADDGAFAIEGLRPGETYTLVALGRGGMQEQQGITAPSKDVEILVGGVGGISGRVVDAPTGKPVTDFTATYEADAGAGPGRRMRGGPPPRSPRGPREGDDDDDAFHSADGTFLIENVPAGTWTVNVEAEGYETARLSGVNVREGETTADVEVRVTHGRILSGRVTDAQTGRPVPGATIAATSATGAGPGGFQGVMASSDADGRFELAGLALGTYRLQAQHPDYAEASQIVDVQQAVGSTDIRLSAGGALAGIVVSESGGPVAGASVALQSGGGGGPRFGGGPGGQPMVTDEAGSFRFDRLAAGRYTIAASAGNRSSAPLEVPLLAGESRADLRIALGVGTTLRGQVSGLGNDLRGSVNVNATGPEGYFAGVRPTVDGSFSLSGVPAGSIHLRATAGSFAAGTRSASADVTIAEGQAEADVDIVFAAGYSLSGTVTRGGDAVAGAMIAASPAGEGPSGTARTDAAGGYSLAGLSAGDYTVTASPPQGASRRQKVQISGDQTLDFALPLAALSGVVVEAGSGLPLGGADVSVDTGEGGPRSGARAVTDSAGRFALEGLEPRSYVLTARLAGYDYDKRTVDAAADGSASLSIELRRGEGVGVRAFDAALGFPLRGLSAEARDNAGAKVFEGRVALDSDGRGEIPSLRPGAYSARLWAQGYAPIMRAVSVPSPTLELGFTLGGTVEIRVGPETLARHPQARLVDSSGAPYALNPFSPDGWFALAAAVWQHDHVAPGDFVLEVVGGPSKPLSVTEGGKAVVDLP